MPQYETVSDYWDQIRSRLDRQERERHEERDRALEAHMEEHYDEVVPGTPIYYAARVQPVEVPEFANTVDDIIKLLSILIRCDTRKYLVSIDKTKYAVGYPLPTQKWEAGGFKKKRWWEREREADLRQMYLPFYIPMELLKVRQRNHHRLDIYLKYPNDGECIACYIDAYLGLEDSNDFAIKAIRLHQRDSIPTLANRAKDFQNAIKDASKAVEKFANKAEMYWNLYSWSSNNVNFNNSFTWTLS